MTTKPQPPRSDEPDDAPVAELNLDSETLKDLTPPERQADAAKGGGARNDDCIGT